MNPATKRKILWIEDDPIISQLYYNALHKKGYDVTIEGNGEKALELAETNQYDFILLDLMLPGLSGSQILSTLRSTEKGMVVRGKIIIMTNLEQRPEIKKNIEHLADAYLIKAEVTPNQLITLLAQM